MCKHIYCYSKSNSKARFLPQITNQPHSSKIQTIKLYTAKTAIVPNTTIMTLEKAIANPNATIEPIIPNSKFPSCTYKIAGKISAPNTAYGILRKTPDMIGGSSLPSRKVRGKALGI